MCSFHPPPPPPSPSMDWAAKYPASVKILFHPKLASQWEGKEGTGMHLLQAQSFFEHSEIHSLYFFSHCKFHLLVYKVRDLTHFLPSMAFLYWGQLSGLLWLSLDHICLGSTKSTVLHSSLWQKPAKNNQGFGAGDIATCKKRWLKLRTMSFGC